MKNEKKKIFSKLKFFLWNTLLHAYKIRIIGIAVVCAHVDTVALCIKVSFSIILLII